jgi:hypothetical protein
VPGGSRGRGPRHAGFITALGDLFDAADALA